MTANRTGTAPVLRGAWIMERYLGTPPANTATKRGNRLPAICRAAPPPFVSGQKSIAIIGLRQLPRRRWTRLAFALVRVRHGGAYHTIDAQSRQPIGTTAARLPDGTEISGPEESAQGARRPR